MGKNQSASGLTNIIQYNNSGITFVSGSTVLMAISSSGAITTTGVISGSSAANAVSASFALTATSASFASNAANATSSSFASTATSSSFASNAANATSASFASTATSSSFATTALTSSFANNLTVAGTITAQTLNVQQVTSSVIYSSGSNVFGNSLANTQVFTGSVAMTGSLSVNGVSTLSGALSGTSATFSGNVGINGVAATYPLYVRVGTNQRFRVVDGGSGYTQLASLNDAENSYTPIMIGNSWLSIASTGAATFASSISATTLALGSVTPSSNGIYLNAPSANGANYGYIRTNALTVNTTQLILGSTYGFNTPVDALTIYNGNASFAGSIGGSSANISSTSITTTPSTTLSTSRGIMVDAATTTNNAFVPIGFSWASSVSTYDPTWGMALKTVSYNAGTADLVFYTAGSVRMTIGNGGGTTFTGGVTAGGNISANNINTFSLTLQGPGTPVSTGLPINALTGGRTYLLLTSQQWDAGNSTSSTITMIRCGYDGNNFTAVVLGSSNATLETWSQSGGILFVTGNTNFAMDITVISNG